MAQEIEQKIRANAGIVSEALMGAPEEDNGDTPEE